MLAYNGDYDIYKDVRYPCGASPKLDGIRCVRLHSGAFSRTFKQIPNNFVRAWIEHNIRPGNDGEIVVYSPNGTMLPFNDVQSMIMSKDGDEFSFDYFVFDHFGQPELPYVARMGNVAADKILTSKLCNTPEELLAIHASYVSLGYEGTIIRDLYAPYKFGRATLKEGSMFKLVDHVREEGIIRGFTENKFHRNRIGAIVIHTDEYGSVKLGSGFDLALSKQFYDRPQDFIGRTVTFKYKKQRTKLKPSQPIFVGFRDEL